MSNASDFKISQTGILTKYTGPGGDVVIPDGVKSIGKDAFSNCTTLRSVSIPAGTKSVGDRAFCGCKNLLNVSFPDNLQSIGLGCFTNCTSLKRIVFPTGIKQIGCHMFVNCSALEEIVFPDSLTEIHKIVFFNCNPVQIIRCSGKLFATFDKVFKDNIVIGWLMGKAEYAADQTTAIKKYISRAGLRLFEMIPEDSAEAVSKLLTLCKLQIADLENWISLCSDGAHPNMLAVLMDYKNKSFPAEDVELFIQGQIERDLGFKERTLAEWKKIFKFVEDAGNIRITGYKGVDNAVVIPEKMDGKPVTLIHDKAFMDNKKITSVSIPEGITGIGKSAFSGCTNLTNFSMPGSITEIGGSAFAYSGLESIVIPEGIASLGWYAFSNCENLTQVTLPESLEEVGSFAFLGCEKLEKITIPNRVKKIGNSAFAGCDNLMYVTLSDSPVKIGPLVFERCEKLESIIIPESVKQLDYLAFDGCSNLKQVTFLGVKTKIGDEAFRNIENLEIHAPSGSYAETYAKEHNIPFVAE